MLSEIKFIQSIGRFETARPTPGATFGPCTLVFGENGWGKSTLADILRSLTTNNPSILAGRATLAADAPPKAVLRFGSQSHSALGGKSPAEAPRRADDDRRGAPQQQVQALLFHWRLEPADNRNIGIPQRPSEVVGLENHVARRAKGTEKANQPFVECTKVPFGFGRRRTVIFGTSL